MPCRLSYSQLDSLLRANVRLRYAALAKLNYARLGYLLPANVGLRYAGWAKLG